MTIVDEVHPSAGRLMSSLRDIGYDAPGAIADLVDNSIDANARRVDVDLVADGDRSYVRVADDGLGMSEAALEEAMRFGTRRTYGSTDLGAFGLGLKTASLSQARSLTVATRSSAQGRLRIRRWDLDKVVSTDRWHLERLSARNARPGLLDPLRGEQRGTVVLWEELDRLIGTPTSPHAARTLGALARRTAEHLGMVFHRFIAGEAGGSPVVIAVNGQTVAGWDPFARDEPATRVLPAQELTFEHGTRTHVVTVEPYILPAQHQFSTTDAHAAASGPSRWNRQQGLYIYRRERLIQAGGWNRLRTLDEHSKLARVAIDLPPGGEEAFGVNVSKMQVSIPDGLRTPLRGILAGVVSRAQDAYRQHGNSRALDGQPVPRRDPSPQPAGWDVGGDWPLISDVLRRELQPDVQVLDRVLVALVNARRPG